MLDNAHVYVTILNRPRKLAVLERRSHAHVLALRNRAPENEGLRAAADCAIDRADEYLVVDRFGQTFFAYLRPTRTGDP
jgi:hypothetical protein